MLSAGKKTHPTKEVTLNCSTNKIVTKRKITKEPNYFLFDKTKKNFAKGQGKRNSDFAGYFVPKKNIVYERFNLTTF